MSWTAEMRTRFRSVQDALAFIGCSHVDVPWVLLEAPAYPFALNQRVAERLRDLYRSGQLDDFRAIARLYLPGRGEVSGEVAPVTGTGEEETAEMDNVYQFFPDRVLIRVTSFCASMCRYCFVRHKVGPNGRSMGRTAFGEAMAIVRKRPEVRDVILSGGDPFLLSDRWIEEIVREAEAIPHVGMLRFDTKVPNVLPARITDGLLGALDGQRLPIYVNVHFSHAAEVDDQVRKATRMLRRVGCVLGAHIPLLRGVNDSPEEMGRLLQRLVEAGVRPYYLIQHIPTDGADSFLVPVEVGQKIMRELWGSLSGLAIPHYVAYLPHGGGKAMLTESQLLPGTDNLVRNHRGEVFSIGL